ncbi:MAG: hypothetical protein NT113_14405 [Hyphomicrobiales bacterium]|nr:hypothetical protein [Hyphomicrobiales bacterium]
MNYEASPDIQFRLLLYRQTRFHGRLHTCGFEYPADYGVLSPQSVLYHFDWCLRTLDERKKKLRRYDAELAGCWDAFQRWYLPEEYMNDFRLWPLTDPDIIRAAGYFGHVTNLQTEPAEP